MPITERITREIASADYTDECRVDVRMRRKRMDLSASQARHFARELMDAADAADRAAASAVRPVETPAVDLIEYASRFLPQSMVEQIEQVAADLNATVEPGTTGYRS